MTFVIIICIEKVAVVLYILSIKWTVVIILVKMLLRFCQIIDFFS